MNEPFLLSNLIELQELDNEIFKLISEKSEGTPVKELKTHEIEFKKLQIDKDNIENELVKDCRERGFAIWPTLSEPVQVRIGILNQLSKTAIREIVIRFADAMARMGAQGIDKAGVLNQVAARFAARGKAKTDRPEPHKAAS